MSTIVSSHRRSTRGRRSATPGVTLIELLVVIIIVMVISTVLLRAMVPAMTSRGVREGARVLSVMISSARNRAIETGRPAGIWIERMAAMPEIAVSIGYAFTPPPYCGDYADSMLEGKLYTNGVYMANIVWPVAAGGSANLDSWASPDPTVQQLVKDGDRLRVKYRGSSYLLQSSDNTPLASLFPNFEISSRPVWLAGWWSVGDPAPLEGPPIVTGGNSVPYQIMRQPQKSAAGQMFMPEGTVIDLNYSGVGSDRAFHPRTNGNSAGKEYGLGSPQFPDDGSPIIVMFDENGTLDTVYCRYWNSTTNAWVWMGRTPLDSIYFLIGRRTNVPVDPSTAASSIVGTTQIGTNWMDATSIWVMISAHTGFVVTTGNYVLNATDSASALSTASNGTGIFKSDKLDKVRAYVNARSDEGS